MKNRFIALILILVTTFAHAPVAAAQDVDAGRDWSALRTLSVGTKLSVKMKSGETVEGRLSGVSDTGLTLSRKNKTVELERGQIRRAYRVGGGSVGKATLIGLGAGAGAGAAIGAGIAAGGTHESGEAALPVLVFGAGGAIIGTAAGLVTGLLGRKRVLIYESE